MNKKMLAAFLIFFRVDVIKINTSKKDGEVERVTPKKEMDNPLFFMTSHMTLSVSPSSGNK